MYPVCLASVSSTAACLGTLFRVMVRVVPLLDRMAPIPMVPYPRTMRSTCRLCVMGLSTAPSTWIDRQLLALTRCIFRAGQYSFNYTTTTVSRMFTSSLLSIYPSSPLSLCFIGCYLTCFIMDLGLIKLIFGKSLPVRQNFGASVLKLKVFWVVLRLYSNTVCRFPKIN